MEWNNHTFSYTPLNIEHLKSIWTESNVKFQFCIKLLQDYNNDIENSKKRQVEIRDGPWKNKVYGTLSNLLNEIISTNDRIL